jgi:hypothetical protein
MKERTGIIGKYAPLWGVVIIMLLLFFSSTLPAIRSARDLKPERDRRVKENRELDAEIRRMKNKLEALDVDPITVENELRNQVGGVRKEGEITVDRD